MTANPIRSILITNRSEIAIRVMRAASGMRIRPCPTAWPNARSLPQPIAPISGAAGLGATGSTGLDFPPPSTPMQRMFNTIFLSAGVQPPSPVVETMSLRTIETVLRKLPNGVTILAKDIVAGLVQRGECAALPYKLSWNLPPVSFFVSSHMASHPTVRSLAMAIRMAANAPATRSC